MTEKKRGASNKPLTPRQKLAYERIKKMYAGTVLDDRKKRSAK